MKKTLIFPRLHKVSKFPRINFGIFKPVTRISGKKNKSASKKLPEKIYKRPFYEKIPNILDENYTYLEEKNSIKNNPPDNLIIKPKNLYDRLVNDKLKPKKLDKSDSSNSSYNSEEKKINKGKINKIKIFFDYNEESTFYSGENNSLPNNNNNISKIPKLNQKNKIEKDKNEDNNNLKNKKNTPFMKIKDNNEKIEEFLENLVKKKEQFFQKNFINKYIFNNINKEIFLEKLIEQMNKSDDFIPLYLYEDDSFFEEIALKIILEEIEKNELYYNRNELILPEIVDYHKFLRDFVDYYNSLGGKLALDELYGEEIYIKNKNLKDEQQKIEENKKIKNIIKNKKLLILSEKFKNYLQKNNRRLSAFTKANNNKNEKLSKLNKTSGNNTSNFIENYTNIISKVIKNRKNFNKKFEKYKKKRSKKLSLGNSELISIQKMIGGHLRSTGKHKFLLNEDTIYDDEYIYNKKIKKFNMNESSKLNNLKYKWYNNEYSYLDCPELYERPDRKKFKIEEIQGLIKERKRNKKNKNKRAKSMYNKFFHNKFKK